jgi:plastocyanin
MKVLVPKWMFSTVLVMVFIMAAFVILNGGSSIATIQEKQTVTVAAGGGNATAPWTVFVPEEIRIKAGDTVVWDNPTKYAAEPHTVTFVLDNSTMAHVEAPLGVSNTTEFTVIPPGSNNEPILIPGEEGINTVISVNARTFNPTVIDSQGAIQFMNPNANYTMTGDEKYINSGWLLPTGLEGLYPGSGNTFSVTFEEPGTYEYLCIIHPWMTGSIVVEE